jgi:hypothetical protein
MGKRSKKTKHSENPKIKFIIIGIIVAVIVAGIAAISMNPDSIKVDNPRATKLSLDTQHVTASVILLWGQYVTP